MQEEHVNKVISRYGLHRGRGPGKMRFNGRIFVPDDDLKSAIPRYLKEQRDRFAADKAQHEAIRDEDVQRALDEEIAYMQRLDEGGYSVM